MKPRIAIIQHGDFLEAARRMDAGEPEFYAGVRHSVDVLRSLVDGVPHLLISLGGRPCEHRRGDAWYLTLPEPRRPAVVPARFRHRRWASRLVRALGMFEPTHVLSRTGGLLGIAVAEYCRRHRVAMLVMLANSVDDPSPVSRRYSRRLMRLLNASHVFRVGNFKRVAAESMIQFGLDAAKAVPYEFPGARHPRDYPAKWLPADGVCRIVFAANWIPEKGPEDIVEAAAHLHRAGRPFHLTMLGDGSAAEQVRERAEALPPEQVALPGWVDNDRMFDLLRQCTLACVPTRPEWVEGLPLALTESLASRSPVIASDHPVFTSAFQDGEGVRFFAAGDAVSLAETIEQATQDEAAYQRLSETTLDAYDRVSCATTFGDVVGQWRATFDDR